jgi:hypothetical protein
VHNLYVNAKDDQGRWSFMQKQQFCVEPDIDFTSDGSIHSIGDSVHFYISAPLDKDLIFDWDFTNSGNYQSLTGRTVAHFYPIQGEYQVTLKASYPGGCTTSVSKTFNFSITTNIDMTKANDKLVFIYPNPSNGIFNLRVENSAIRTNIQLISIDGKMIYNENVTSSNDKTIIKEFNINSLPSGIYVLKIADNQSVLTKSIIKINK